MSMYVCLMQPEITNVTLLHCNALNYDFNGIVTQINFNDENETENFIDPDKFSTTQWDKEIIIKFPDDLCAACDSTDMKVRLAAEEKLRRDLSWTNYLQHNGIKIISLNSRQNVNLGRILMNNFKGYMLVQVPLCSPPINNPQNIDGTELAEVDDPWAWWNNFRFAANCDSKLGVVLKFEKSAYPSWEVVRRWIGESVQAVVVPEDMFVKDEEGDPMLIQEWQKILKCFLNAHVNIIFCASEYCEELDKYGNYLKRFSKQYDDTHLLQQLEDCFMLPLQPLHDDLDCRTYEIFEKDPVKYKLYQDAITAALVDRVPEKDAAKKKIILMILGAGRGPLVRAAINAGKNTKRMIRVYIVEKNPNVISTLVCVIRKLWSDLDIHLFNEDMRTFTPPEKADILISELLGSFGDNELMPECLECAKRLLKDNGISIPYKATSYINPVMSFKFMNNIRIHMGDTTWDDRGDTAVNNRDRVYGVLPKNVYNIALPQPLFEFEYPNRQRVADHRRFKALKFESRSDCLLNGITGFFDALLYEDIKISINPLTHSRGMFSWFPVFFPFTEPINIKKGDIIEIHFWRCVSREKVWYEWCLVSPETTRIHNLNGCSYPIYCI